MMPVSTPQYNPGVPTYSYDDELAMAEEQLARADALRKQARGPAPKGQMVSGWYVAPHWSEQLSPILNEVLAGYHEGKGREAKQRGNRAIEEEAQAWMTNRPQARQEQFEQPGPQPQELEGQPLMGQRTVQPTQQDNLQWAQQGMRNPLTKALAAQYGADVLIKEPEREEARAFRGAEAEKQRETQKEMARERNAMMQTYYQGIISNGQNSVEQRRDAAAALASLKKQELAIEQQGMDLKKHLADQTLEIAKMRDLTERYKVDERSKANRGKMNAKALSELDEADQIRSGIDLALSKLSKVEDSKGGAFVRGAVAENVLGGGTLANMMRDEPDKDARQTAMDISGGIQHGRYGTSLTKTEKGAASGYIPTQYDDSTELARKLKGLQELMALNHKRLRLMEQGGTSMEEAQRAFPSGGFDVQGGSSTSAPAKLPPNVRVIKEK